MSDGTFDRARAAELQRLSTSTENPVAAGILEADDPLALALGTLQIMAGDADDETLDLMIAVLSAERHSRQD